MAQYSMLVGLALIAILVPLPGTASSAPPGAERPFVPYTGSSVATYLAAPQQGIMPPNATLDLGWHKSLLSWSFKDATHYRAMLDIVQPAIDSGTVTIVANGTTVTTFDERSRTATVVHLGIPPHQLMPATAPSLLDLEGNTPLTPPGLDPNPAQPLHQVEQAMIHSRPEARVRIAGKQSILGHQADVLELQPLESTVWSTCKPPSRTGCAHPILHEHPWGWAKVWVDRQHPFILRSQDGGIPLGMRNGGIRHGFQVLSVSYGLGPSPAALRYRPPVKPQRLDYWCDPGCTYGQGWSSWQSSTFPHFYDMPRPQLALVHRLPRTQVFAAGDGFSEQPSGVDILYSTGRHHDYYHPRDLPQIYALGAYVYLQERIQVHGLPAALKTGSARAAGRCQAWGGTYADGNRWLAFQRGSISFFLYSNALSEQQLVQYAAGTACAGSS